MRRITQEEVLLLAEVRARCASGEARKLRIDADLTFREVGEHCGVTGDTVRGWELARCAPRGTPALRYARLLAELAARQSDEVAS